MGSTAPDFDRLDWSYVEYFSVHINVWIECALVTNKSHHSTSDVAKPHPRKLYRATPSFKSVILKVFFSLNFILKSRAKNLQISAKEPV